jgi:hypothetical protein
MSGDEYRELANECVAAAGRTDELGRTISLLILARRWLRMAEQEQQRRRDMVGDVLLDPPGPTTTHIELRRRYSRIRM